MCFVTLSPAINPDLTCNLGAHWDLSSKSMGLDAIPETDIVATLRQCHSKEPWFLFSDLRSSDGKFCCFRFISSKTWLSGEELLDEMVCEKGSLILWVLDQSLK